MKVTEDTLKKDIEYHLSEIEKQIDVTTRQLILHKTMQEEKISGMIKAKDILESLLKKL